MSERSEHAHFEVFEGQDDEHYWHLRAANGEVLCVSEAYTRGEDAARGAADAAKAALEASAGALVRVAIPSDLDETR